MPELNLGHIKGADGAPGKDGKSAYQYAVDGGYKGTEDDFKRSMAEAPWVPDSEKGAPNGVAELDGNGLIPQEQIPSLSYIPSSKKGTPNGVASLGEDGKVLQEQVPELPYIPSTQKGAVNGVASLGKDGKVPLGQLPSIPDAFPAGGIILWSGAADAVPAGWTLCNGQNGAPDLRDRFVIGAGNAYSVGNTGGEATHVLSEAEMPRHSHSSGSLSADSAGEHYHSFTSQYGDYRERLSESGPQNSGSFIDANHTATAGSHSHSIYGSTSSAGSGQAHNNLPPYYALCYIMKI